MTATSKRNGTKVIIIEQLLTNDPGTQRTNKTVMRDEREGKRKGTKVIIIEQLLTNDPGIRRTNKTMMRDEREGKRN